VENYGDTNMELYASYHSFSVKIIDKMELSGWRSCDVINRESFWDKTGIFLERPTR